jgi:(p)ppGpp synthase/HD superfamily hydrolase
LNHNLIIQCAQWSYEGHKTQPRKFTGRPYFEHPQRLANRAMLVPNVLEEVVGACYTHDLKEDQPEFWEEILPHVNPEVVRMTNWLTNPSKSFPDLPRAEKKKMDREHLSKAPHWVKYIKYIDRIDNLNELGSSLNVPADWLKMYLRESWKLKVALYESGIHEALDMELGNLTFELFGRLLTDGLVTDEPLTSEV